MLMLCMLLFLLRSLHCKRCDGPLCTLTLTCSNPGGGWELPTDDAAKDPGFFAGPRFWASHLKSWAFEHVPQCATCLLCSVRVEMNYRQPQHNVSSTMMYSDNDMLHDSWWQECVGPAPLSSEKVLQTSANIRKHRIHFMAGRHSIQPTKFPSGDLHSNVHTTDWLFMQLRAAGWYFGRLTLNSDSFLIVEGHPSPSSRFGFRSTSPFGLGYERWFLRCSGDSAPSVKIWSWGAWFQCRKWMDMIKDKQNKTHFSRYVEAKHVGIWDLL